MPLVLAWIQETFKRSDHMVAIFHRQVWMYFLDFHQINTMMGITWTLASLCIFASSILLSAPLRPLTFLLRVNLEVKSWRSCRLNSYRWLNLKKSFSSIIPPKKVPNHYHKLFTLFWKVEYTLQMFCLLNPQMNACELNPKTTSSDFNRWKSLTKIFCFHAISTDICLLF